VPAEYVFVPRGVGGRPLIYNAAMVEPSIPASFCVECGAPLNAGQKVCWLCSRNVGPMDLGRSSARSTAAPSASNPLQYSIGALLIVTTVIAVLVGAFRVAPGLGILLTFVAAVSAVPAWIRSVVQSQRSEQPMGFLQSFIISVAATTVGIVACAAAAFAAIIVGCGIGTRSKLANDAALALLVGSPVIGLVVGALIHWLAWPRKK
jgi:hypothetical protein